MKTIISDLSILISAFPVQQLIQNHDILEKFLVCHCLLIPISEIQKKERRGTRKEVPILKQRINSRHVSFSARFAKRCRKSPCCGTSEAERLKWYSNLYEYPSPLYMGFLLPPPPSGHVICAAVHLPVMKNPLCKARIKDCVETFFCNSQQDNHRS